MDNLNVRSLKLLIKAYNLHEHISKYSKLVIRDLVEAINTHLVVKDGYLVPRKDSFKYNITRFAKLVPKASIRKTATSEEKAWIKQIHLLQKDIKSILEEINSDETKMQALIISKTHNKKVVTIAWKVLCKHIETYHNLSRIAFYMSVGDRNWQDERKQYLLEDKYIFKDDYKKSKLVDVLHFRDNYATVVQKCLQAYSTRAYASILEFFNDNGWEDLADEFMKFKYTNHQL